MKGIDAVLTLIWTIGIFALVLYLLWWGAGKLGLGEPWGRIVNIILVALTVFLCIGIVFGRVPLIPFCQIGQSNICQ